MKVYSSNSLKKKRLERLGKRTGRRRPPVPGRVSQDQAHLGKLQLDVSGGGARVAKMPWLGNPKKKRYLCSLDKGSELNGRRTGNKISFSSAGGEGLLEPGSKRIWFRARRGRRDSIEVVESALGGSL